jgi:Rap1a immunity proteins
MRTLIAAAVLLSFLSEPATSAFYTGNDLYVQCTAKSAACIAYVEGTADALAQDGNVCIPPQLTGNKVADVIMDFLGDHPELRPASAASIGYIALQRAFPCADQAH